MFSERQLFLNFLAQTSDFPLLLEFEKAKGIYLYDISGKSYIDLISGISVSNLGHSNQRIIDAVKTQLDKHMHLMVYGEYVQSPQTKYAKKLTSVLPEQLKNVYLVNSGSEAIEGALKLAKRYTGKQKIFSFKNAYHGSSHGALSIMGNENFKQAFRPLLPEVYHINFNSFEDLALIDDKTACVIVEPIQAEAGIIKPNEGFLQAIRQKCDEAGALLIFDEVQTGMGRTGSLFAFEKYNVIPDILVLAKGIGGGMPLGAFVSSKEIMSVFKNNPILGHITTFGGHPVSCAAALEALNIILEENLIAEVEAKSSLFVKNIKHKAIKEIRTAGMMIAIELENFEMVQKVVKHSIESGVIIDWFLFCDNSIRIAPPLIITNEEILKACEVINKAIELATNEK